MAPGVELDGSVQAFPHPLGHDEDVSAHRWFLAIDLFLGGFYAGDDGESSNFDRRGLSALMTLSVLV